MEKQANETFSNPALYVPKIIFFTRGKGIHKDYLTSFELALRDAEIADLNLVSVSSIKPPHCKIVSRQEGRKYLLPGQVVFTIMARSATNEPNRLIAASIGLATTVMTVITDICQSTIQLVKRHKKPEIMRKIWQWKCLPQR